MVLLVHLLVVTDAGLPIVTGPPHGRLSIAVHPARPAHLAGWPRPAFTEITCALATLARYSTLRFPANWFPAPRRVGRPVPGPRRAVILGSNHLGGRRFMKSWPGYGTPAYGHPAMLASDADRDHAAEVLKSGFATGRLTKDEYDDYLHRLYTARTYGDLVHVTRQLPGGGMALFAPPAPAGQTH